MRPLLRPIFSSLCICLLILSPASVSGLEVIDHSSNVFKFQEKLANKGNAHAQYKLATMYESGIGVESNIGRARQWYEKASNAGIKAASDRNIFLTVKAKGYQHEKHHAWVKSVKTDADNHSVDATLLLAELYRNGTGVSKDLNKSLALFAQVSSSGDANVDAEIASIRNELDAIKSPSGSSQQKHDTITTTNTQFKFERVLVDKAKVERIKSKKPLQQQKKIQNFIDKKQLLRAEKRRHYEKVMQQIRLEQQEIDDLQALVSGEDGIELDDEI